MRSGSSGVSGCTHHAVAPERFPTVRSAPDPWWWSRTHPSVKSASCRLSSASGIISSQRFSFILQLAVIWNRCVCELIGLSCVKPYLPPSTSRVEYDSEESEGSEDEEDEEDEEEGDSFDPNSPLAEHSNNSSYRWARLIVKRSRSRVKHTCDLISKWRWFVCVY